MILERLEERRLLSVTVSQGYPGYYEIQGDESQDVIHIDVSMTNETFTLNGTTYTGVTYLFIDGKGSADDISVTSAEGSGVIGASINGGDGQDSITLNFDGAVWGGAGNDIIHLNDSFRGECYGQEGNDQMFISGACVDAQIRGGEGNDLIDCSGNYYGVIVFGGTGNDTIIGSNYDDQVYGEEGKDSISGGSGSDTFYAEEDDTIDGGDGYDFVCLNGTQSSVLNCEAIYS